MFKELTERTEPPSPYAHARKPSDAVGAKEKSEKY